MIVKSWEPRPQRGGFESRIKAQLIVLSLVVALLTVFAFWPDSARVAWERYKRARISSGDLIEWANSLPGPLPSRAENFGGRKKGVGSDY